MAWFGPSNQLISIDTGLVRTSLYNPAQSPVAIYAGIGQGQVLGQRYVGVGNTTATNAFGAPAIFILVQYLKTSATVTGNIAAAPAPVYWTDSTFTTVSGISSESGFGLNGIAGYLMVNTTSLPGITGAQLLGAQIFIQVAGFLNGALAPTTNQAAGNKIIPSAGTFTSAGVAAGTSTGYKELGIQTSATASSLCGVLVSADNF